MTASDDVPPTPTNKVEEETKKEEENKQHEAVEKRASSGSDGVTRRQRTSKTEKEMVSVKFVSCNLLY